MLNALGIGTLSLDQAAGEYASTTFYTSIQMFLGDVTRYVNTHQIEVALSVLGLILLVVFLFKKG